MLMSEVEYTAMLLGATGNVGGRILHLLVRSPLCRKDAAILRVANGHLEFGSYKRLEG